MPINIGNTTNSPCRTESNRIRGKQFLYDGGIRIPMIMRWPGKVPRGQVSNDLVMSIDICATILDAAFFAASKPTVELFDLNNGPLVGNTIVVLWSDHGYHLGHKQHWEKRVLWDQATRVPLMIAGRRYLH